MSRRKISPRLAEIIGQAASLHVDLPGETVRETRRPHGAGKLGKRGSALTYPKGPTPPALPTLGFRWKIPVHQAYSPERVNRDLNKLAAEVKRSNLAPNNKVSLHRMIQLFMAART